MKGYTVTMRYTTSIDVFVAAEEDKPIEEVVEAAKTTIDMMSDEAYSKELVKNLTTDNAQPYTIKKM